jgi:Ankyrin repeats (3 copies)
MARKEIRMSDALPLPSRPNLEQYKKLAKDLQQACKSHDSGAIRAWAQRWVETLVRLQGRSITSAAQAEMSLDKERVVRQWHRTKKSNERAARGTLADAQFFVARCHGFASWPKFARHVEALARANSPISNFELGADAIVDGDLATLERLLCDHPELIRARSTREHRSTLLHYVSANGIEDFRQKTPPNIVAIAKRLLDAGADVNAESDAYGGRSTALGLTATSCHPDTAGVQIALLEVLIEHGAIIDGPEGGCIVNSCLGNGRGKAAEFLASRGARLDLEGAAGLSRIDVVQSCFNADGSLKPPATQGQLKAGFAWACEFGRLAVVQYLLSKGIEAGDRLHPDGGETGLHWAAFAGHADIVGLLLDHGAEVDVKDKRFDGTPLGWALYGWGSSPTKTERRGYYEAVALLARAGAKRNPQGSEDDEQRLRADKKIQSDARMMAALRGEMPAT